MNDTNNTELVENDAKKRDESQNEDLHRNSSTGNEQERQKKVSSNHHQHEQNHVIQNETASLLETLPNQLISLESANVFIR